MSKEHIVHAGKLDALFLHDGHVLWAIKGCYELDSLGLSHLISVS